ncbi:MAG: RNA dependent RNA polymerase [Bacteriophage sp.]|nr:MAG: RNA dependent RNA polymerase [Bacteriophage sp.]
MGNQIYGDILIRNIDASYLYWKIKDDAAIKEYEQKKKEIVRDGSKEENKTIEEEVEKMANQIFSFKPEITLPKKDTRYMYSGTLTDSLMTRHLREVVKDTDDAIRMDSKAPGTVYTDVIINLKFKSDVIIKTDENKKKYNNRTGIIEETEEKKNKCLLSAEKLRKLAYRDGITINGVHYVNFQRTSSKARTGNCLFIDDKYFDAMEKWQTMEIPFREIFAKDDKIDIVSTRSYESLTSSSIIGTIDIDPYSILLIDEADGTETMPCNVVTLNPDTKRLQVAKQDYEKHIDLWDGQSLADESIFESGTYVDRRDGQEHSYRDKGFLLLRNHFFKSAIFNTRLQSYYKEVFVGIENPIIKDRFGNEFNPFDVKLVTTKNSVKILKFSHVVARYMVNDSKKDKLKELESEIEKFENKRSEINNRASVAKRNLTIVQKKDGVTSDQLKAAQQKEK